MTMIETVKRMLRQSDRELVVECRQCGSNADPGTESCPVCDSTEISVYPLNWWTTTVNVVVNRFALVV